MKINHNRAAYLTNNQLLRTENALATVTERLSSGLKINHSKDDPAGMAISTKMKAQIRGLDRASNNASDGNSAIETADGALNEVTSIIQRMRELAVQAANDTNTESDKDAAQKEIENLKAEIDRISKDTEFNTKTLLNGNLSTRVYSNTQYVSRIQTSDEVIPGKYGMMLIGDAKAASYETTPGASATDTVIPDNCEGVVTINGSSVTVNKGDTPEAVYQKIRNAAETGGATVTYTESSYTFTSKLTFTTDEVGSSASLKVECGNDNLATFLGIPSSASSTEIFGEDAEVSLERKGIATDGRFSKTASCSVKGDKITITDINGFNMSFRLDGTKQDLIDAGHTPVGANNDVLLTFDVTEVGNMVLQVGAKENQIIKVNIPEVSTESMYIDKLDVTKVGGASKAIAALDDALAYVSDVRSRLGAYENRLDSAIASLDLTSQNMTSALSRLEDADMAEEMTEYTKYNVLSQAATSVLAQANEQPQKVLQLLG